MVLFDWYIIAVLLDLTFEAFIFLKILFIYMSFFNTFLFITLMIPIKTQQNVKNHQKIIALFLN